MKIEEFNEKFKNLKDVEIIDIDCEHPDHVGETKCQRSKVVAKRNIKKNNGERFICGDCNMKYNNPMKVKRDIKRQTDEEIIVICTNEKHVGDRARQIKMSAYFGTLEKPYTQECKSCAQIGKVISGVTQTKHEVAAKIFAVDPFLEFALIFFFFIGF